MANGIRVNGEPSEIGKKILDVLSDGGNHLRKELLACLEDSEVSADNLNPYMSNLRKYLRPRGIDIVCVYMNRRIAFRMVRLLRNTNRD